jgi:acetylornithine deacetylase/succinyl-diaminopimelate desuccinylase-like protein
VGGDFFGFRAALRHVYQRHMTAHSSTPAALDDLLTCLRFASVSTDRAHAPQVRACAEWLVAKLRDMKLATTLHETPRHPIIVARSPKLEGKPTLLIYGHYDVQPVDPLDQWVTPPFEPRITDGRIYARGSTDNKGQLMAHLCGVEATLAQAAGLPLNLIFLFEGEEEIGSPNLAPFLRAHAAELACDIIAISDTGMVAPGVPTFTYGLRGIACLEVEVSGPTIDLHSGIFGGAVANPNTIMARLVASLHDAEERVRVPHFYDKVRPVEAWERAAWSQLPGGAAETLALTGVPMLSGEAGFSDHERRWARPTAEVNGIGGGYQGEGSKTVIPQSAFAKFSFRLVPDQDPAEILQSVKDYLTAQCPATVRLNIKAGHSGMPYAMDPNSAFGMAARRALESTFKRETALIREGGSIPIVQAFRDILGVETLLLGLALPDCQAHAPNENFPIENFVAGQALNQALLREIAAV